MARRRQWATRSVSALTALTLVGAMSLALGGASAQAASIACNVSATANAPTKSGARIAYTGSYQVSGCNASYTVALRLMRGATVVGEYRTTGSAPMSGPSSLRSSWACSTSGTYHTEMILYGPSLQSHVPSGKRSFSC